MSPASVHAPMLAANGSDKSAHPARFPAHPVTIPKKIKATRVKEERVRERRSEAR